MALSEAQVANAKKTLSKLTHEELLEVMGIVKELIKQQELVNPAAEQDDSTKFLLSMIRGEDQLQQADDAAVNKLVSLAQGRPETPQADDAAVSKLVGLADVSKRG